MSLLEEALAAIDHYAMDLPDVLPRDEVVEAIRKIVSLLAGLLEARTLAWSTEVPTEEGIYVVECRHPDVALIFTTFVVFEIEKYGDTQMEWNNVRGELFIAPIGERPFVSARRFQRLKED